MRIKNDFVTNSSSTAYVVFIPDNFQLDPEEAEKLFYIEYVEDYENEEYERKALKEELPELIEELKEGKDLWCYGTEGTDPNLYYTIIHICEKNGFILSSSEMGGEGNNTIFGVDQNKIENILMAHMNIDKVLEQVSKGVKLCGKWDKVSP